MLNKTEEQVIRNVILRLRCGTGPTGRPVASRSVEAALTGPAKLYLETRVIRALERLLPEDRDPALALRLSRIADDRDPEPDAPRSGTRRVELAARFGRSVVWQNARKIDYSDKS